MTNKQIIARFRKQALGRFPDARLKVRTVSFLDLARQARLCLSIIKAGSIEDVAQLNALARQYGIVGDGRIFLQSEFKGGDSK